LLLQYKLKYSSNHNTRRKYRDAARRELSDDMRVD
jgi:hypothetical protein